jgi:O-antigen ligase
MSKPAQLPSPRWEPAYLVFFLFLIGINLASLTIFNKTLVVLRYARQPALLVCLLFLLYAFPQNPERKRFAGLVRFFGFFFVYLVFNLITSIDKANTATYAFWLVASYLVIYQFLFIRNKLSFSQLLYQFAWSVFLIGLVSIAISLFGAYVLGLENFFDERYNYSLMRMATEFSGVFGSNNALGFISFITLVFTLLLYQFHKNTSKGTFFLVFSFGLTYLVVFIGNRASMACTGLFWILFLIYVNRSFLGLFMFSVVTVFGFLVYQTAILQKLRLEQFEGGNILGNRSILVDEALIVASEMDFFGVGYHNQRVARKHFRVVGENEKEYNFHNTYLAVYTELGPLGLIWIPGLILWMLFWRSSPDMAQSDRVFLRMLRALLSIMVLIYLPVEDSVNSPGSPSFYFFWISLALLVIGSEGIKSSASNNEKTDSLSHRPV